MKRPGSTATNPASRAAVDQDGTQQARETTAPSRRLDPPRRSKLPPSTHCQAPAEADTRAVQAPHASNSAKPWNEARQAQVYDQQQVKEAGTSTTPTNTPKHQHTSCTDGARR